MCGCLVFLAIRSHAADRFYFIADAGVNFVQDIGFDRIAGVDTDGFSAEVDPGPKGTVGVGYAFLPALAAELEAGVSYNETRTYSAIIGGVPFKGDASLWVVPVTVGVTWRPLLPPPASPRPTEINYWGLKVFERARPFVGAGAGAAVVFGDIDFPVPSSGSSKTSGEDMVFTYYAKAGLTFPLSDKVELGVQYRFSGNPGFEIEDTKADDVLAHSVSAALRVSF